MASLFLESGRCFRERARCRRERKDTCSEQSRQKEYLKNNDSKSWHIFLIQLEKECQKLVFQTGSAQEISFLDSETNKTISIQIKEDKIIKRVNGKGYQPLLIGIKNGQFKNEGQSFTLEVTFTSGKTFDSFFPIKGEF